MIYYNEFNPESAAMLRQMMADDIIPHGDIDERSIAEVLPDDVRGYTQCHFFAGIGGWPIALRLAGWPDNRSVWTGSCPCQPYSSAGRQKGKADDRHLWPVWERLIRECRPASIFGEQVEKAIAHGWLDDVYQGLEAEGYAIGSAVLPACSIGAPHKRDRLWFVAHAEGQRCGRGTDQQDEGRRKRASSQSGKEPMADPKRNGTKRGAGKDTAEKSATEGKGPKYRHCHDIDRQSQTDGNNVANAAQPERELSLAGTKRKGWSRPSNSSDVAKPKGVRGGKVSPDTTGGGKRNSKRKASRPFDGGRWAECPDGKARVVEPSISLLAHGVQFRRPLLHAIGNAIVPQLAAEFIKAST